MHIVIMVVAALAVLGAVLVSELGGFGASSASVTAQLPAPPKETVQVVSEAKTNIEKVRSGTSIQDLSLQDPSEACRDRAKELAKDRGRTKYAWATNVRAYKTRKIKTDRGNPAFLVNVKADGERTFCAVIFENSSCKVDMLTCAEEQNLLRVTRFGKLAAK